VTGRGMASRKATQGLEARYILGMRLGGNKEVQKSPFPAWEVPGRGENLWVKEEARYNGKWVLRTNTGLSPSRGGLAVQGASF